MLKDITVLSAALILMVLALLQLMEYTFATIGHNRHPNAD
jgi:hypothetical protein